MKNYLTLLLLILLISKLLYSEECGSLEQPEFYFRLKDNIGAHYTIYAEKYGSSPIYDYNFQITNQWDEQWERLDDNGNPRYFFVTNEYNIQDMMGFDWGTRPDQGAGCRGILGYGLYRIDIMRDSEPPFIFSFYLDLRQTSWTGSPDLFFWFDYYNGTATLKVNKSGGEQEEVEQYELVELWTKLGIPLNRDNIVKNSALKNDFNGNLNSNVPIVLEEAENGFPLEEYNPGHSFTAGSTANFWKEAYYEFSVTGGIVNFSGNNFKARHWNDQRAFGNVGRIQIFENQQTAFFKPVIPLTVTNNLEGGSSNNDYEITWNNPDPEIITNWQYGTNFNAFDYTYNSDFYSVTASDQFQALGTTWWFHNWDNGSTNTVRPNIQVTTPTTITAYYKGNLCSNDQNAISSASQRKIVRTDNGQYHCVYESMGTVFYTYSLTSDFYGAWSPDEYLHYYGKNPAIDYNGNTVRIVFEYYDPQVGGDATIYLVTYESAGGGTYEQQDYEEVTTYPNSYYGNSKPVISYSLYEIFIAYRIGQNGALKQKTKWWKQVPNPGWYWGNEADIPGTNADCINPSVTGYFQTANVGFVFIAYENYGTIYFKQARRMPDIYDNPYWDYQGYADHPVNLSALCGFNLNRYPVISLANENLVNQYLMVSWQGIYNGTPTNPLPKIDGTKPLYRQAAVVKTGFGTNWGTPSNFSSNVDYTSNSSLNTLYGSIMTWSESNGQYSKYVRRRTTTGYDPITSLSNNGIQTLISNGSEFGNVKAMVFNKSGNAPYFINWCTNDFTYIPDFGKITEDGLIEISYGRSGIVEKNSVEFVFNIGDVLLDGETIKFIERVDTLPILNIEDLNSSVRSDTLNLNDNSELIFSDYYYVLNSEKADSLLSNEFRVNFKCELVKLSTGEVVGKFEEVNYNNGNLEEYGQQGYMIDCSGIEAGEYYLRLTTSVNEEVNLSLSDIQMDNVNLEKSELNIRNFKGSDIPLEYSLEQNYPNPFNPATTIRYQIPKDGVVSLKIYDILGAEVATLVNEEKVAGKYEINFNANNLASGVYIYRLNVNDYVNVKKMILLK